LHIINKIIHVNELDFHRIVSFQEHDAPACTIAVLAPGVVYPAHGSDFFSPAEFHASGLSGCLGVALLSELLLIARIQTIQSHIEIDTK